LVWLGLARARKDFSGVHWKRVFAGIFLLVQKVFVQTFTAPIYMMKQARSVMSFSVLPGGHSSNPKLQRRN
jgi:hypothetical protein